MPPSAVEPSAVLWACVEDGFHVGSRAGEFLGFVDRQGDGAFRACDAHAAPIGDFPTLRAATDAVVAADEQRKGALQ